MSANDADSSRLLLNGREGIIARGEKLQKPLHLGEFLGVRLDGAETRFVVISKGRSAGEYPATHLLADAPADVRREVADVLVGHAEFDCYHEHVVGRQVRSFKGANFLDDSALKQADDLAAVVEVAGKTVELPREDGVGLPALDAGNHVVENRPAGSFGALAFGERVNDYQAVVPRDAVQFRKLGFDGKDLAVFVLARPASVYEVFKHGHSVSDDVIKCENKMRGNTHFTVPKDLLKRLRGTSPSERLLHRLHSVAIVMAGRSASEAARLYGDSPRAVAYWVTWYKKKGFAGLAEEGRPGRPSKFNPSQLKKLQTFMERSRKGSGSLKVHVLRDYIKDSFGITLTIRQCFRILKRFSS